MTDSRMFGAIRNHFASVASELHSRAQQAGILANPTGVGQQREEVYRSFLERHAPKVCDIFLGGYVFDVKGNQSKQADIIVTGSNTPRFKLSDGDKFIAPLEGTIAVIEVKSRLDKRSLQQGLDFCLSIPQMPPPEGIVPPFVQYDEEAWADTPYKVVFAFDGIERSSLQEALVDFVKHNRDQPASRFPNMIHVLGKYAIRKVHASQVRDRSSGEVAPDIRFAYHTFSRNADVLAMMEIINTIQHAAFASNHLKFDYSEWYGQILQMLEQEE